MNGIIYVKKGNYIVEENICFIVSPIGEQGSITRRFADGIVEAVIEPVLLEKKMKPVIAHKISETGSINDQVIRYLYDSKLAIVNLTNLNPNVMYELGVRYTMRKHTILICENGTNLPFDIINERTIFYENDIAGSMELSESLKNMLDNIDYEKKPDNPIFKVLDLDHAMGKIQEEDATKAIMDQLKKIIESPNRQNNITNNNNLNIYCTFVSVNNAINLPENMQRLAGEVVANNPFFITPSGVVYNSVKTVATQKFYTNSDKNVVANFIRQKANEIFKGQVEIMIAP